MQRVIYSSALPLFHPVVLSTGLVRDEDVRLVIGLKSSIRDQKLIKKVLQVSDLTDFNTVEVFRNAGHEFEINKYYGGHPSLENLENLHIP